MRDRRGRELEPERNALVSKGSAGRRREVSADRLPGRQVPVRERPGGALGPCYALAALRALRALRALWALRALRALRTRRTRKTLHPTCSWDACDLPLAVAHDDAVWLRRNGRRLPAQEVRIAREVRLHDVRSRLSDRRDAEHRNNKRGRGQDDWQSVLQATFVTRNPLATGPGEGGSLKFR